MHPSAILPLEGTIDGPTRRSCTVKYLQNHDRSLSNHLRNPLITVQTVTISYLNTLGLHGCGKEISKICPYPSCPINISFSSTPSPSCHSVAPNPLPWQRQYSGTPRTSTRTSSNDPQRRNGHQLHRPRGQFIILFLFALSLYSYSSTIPFTEYSFFLLFFVLSSKISRIWPIRS